MASGLTVDEAMRLVYEAFCLPHIEEGIEFTERMYSEMNNVPPQSVGRQLQDAVDAGVLSWRYVICNGRRCKGYRLTNKGAE